MIPILGISVWTIVKGFVIFALLLYGVFAFVVVRQVRLMTDTLELGFETPIKLIAWGHLLFTAGLLLLAFLIL